MIHTVGMNDELVGQYERTGISGLMLSEPFKRVAIFAASDQPDFHKWSQCAVVHIPLSYEIDFAAVVSHEKSYYVTFQNIQVACGNFTTLLIMAINRP